MNSIILEFDGFPLTVARMDPQMCRHLDRTAMIAESFLEQQNPALWSVASDARFLHRLKQGTARLGVFARSQGTRVAFDSRYLVDCLSILDGVTRFCHLTVADRRSIQSSLQWIAAILPCPIRRRKLPPWLKVRTKGAFDPRVRRLYEQIGQYRSCGRKAKLPKMDEALLLLRALSAVENQAAIKTLRKDLERHTEGYQNILRNLRG